MNRYFLDTHILTWLITNDSQLDKNLRFDIEYPSGNQYITSEYVILEIIQLKQLGKIKYNGSVNDLFDTLASMNIEIELVTKKIFNTLDRMPILTIKNDKHKDMIDRIIIAHSIACKHTLISHDSKFPHYRKYGLKLQEA